MPRRCGSATRRERPTGPARLMSPSGAELRRRVARGSDGGRGREVGQQSAASSLRMTALGGRLDPVGELLEGQATLGGRGAQALDAGVAFGVGGPHVHELPLYGDGDRGRGRSADRSGPARGGRAACPRRRRAVQHGAHARAARAGRALPRLPVRRRLRRAAARPPDRGRRQARQRRRHAPADDARARRARRGRRGDLPLLHRRDLRAGARPGGGARGAARSRSTRCTSARSGS